MKNQYGSTGLSGYTLNSIKLSHNTAIRMLWFPFISTNCAVFRKFLIAFAYQTIRILFWFSCFPFFRVFNINPTGEWNNCWSYYSITVFVSLQFSNAHFCQSQHVALLNLKLFVRVCTLACIGGEWIVTSSATEHSVIQWLHE